MNANTKWIWKNGANDANTWMNFVKRFELGIAPKKAVVRIAVDSKYWLYINGTPVVFEGGLKRGASTHSTYYDEIDITDYLKSGMNTFAVLVWYFGKNGFSHLSSGMGGLLFEADIDGEIISSDGTWRVMGNPAYIEPDRDDMPPNFRLSEANVYFDARRDLGEWYLPNYDTAAWSVADVICDAGYGIWGKLEKRMIPQLKNYGMRDYVNSVDFRDFTTTQDTIVEMKVPYNAQLTPYLKISSTAGKKIVIKTDTYDAAPTQKNQMAVYYTKDGEQEYESLGWINGERVYYTIPEGVTIHSLQYRETGYDTEFVGNFECDDEFLNKLWQKSLRTLYITMRDNFMDCPDRERAQWWGDVNIEMQMMMYCLDKKSLLLYKKGADSLAGWAADYGYMLTVVPSGNQIFELPLQNLAGIWGFSYYYHYTGDKDVLEKVYPMSKSYILNYPIHADGTVAHKKGSWDWADWGTNEDIKPMENAWYYMALVSCKKMAEVLGINGDVELYEEHLEKIKLIYNNAFGKGGYIYNVTANKKPDDRANALAVLSGLADEKQYDSVLKVLQSSENASPYMEKYVLDAMCEMGYIDEAIKRMKRRYKEMVEYEYSTLWEYWNTDGTRNHAWSGGPLITMSKYVAGICPIDTAYETFRIKPHMGALKFIKCTVPSIKGDIVLDVRKTEESIIMNITIPQSTTAEVYLPLEGMRISEDEKRDFMLVDGYAKFVLSSGTHELCGRSEICAPKS